MIATPRSTRRSLSRRTRVLGASAIALTGLMSTYLQVLRTPSAYASTTCTVTDGTDNVGSAPAGSLRDCITQVETGGGGTITFDVTDVTLVGQLPVVTESLHLDGGVNGVTITGGGGPGLWVVLRRDHRHDVHSGPVGEVLAATSECSRPISLLSTLLKSPM